MVLHLQKTFKEPVGLCDPCYWNNFIHMLHPGKRITRQEAGSKVLSWEEGRLISARLRRGKKPVSQDTPSRAGIMDVLVPFLQLLVLLLTLPLHLLALLGFWQPMCKTYFPYLMANLTERANKKMESKKRELFSQIKDLKGTSGKVTLLELGCGTGANFQFYPSNCKITCVDPNPNFEKFLTKSMAKNRHLEYERFIVAYGEDMKQLADSSMDVVVCTLVLCSVQSPKKVLQEIQRVLRPGGLLFFWEHVAEPRESWAYLWQRVFEPTWKHIGDGCNLTRETWKDLEKAGFFNVQMEWQPPLFKWLPVGPHIMGKAVK